ncbi:MAG TPA: hypothetical protein VFA71_03895 [Terriglobales bacterium]|nr:hypothetical protein [Terriglobales bacterium]
MNHQFPWITEKMRLALIAAMERFMEKTTIKPGDRVLVEKITFSSDGYEAEVLGATADQKMFKIQRRLRVLGLSITRTKWISASYLKKIDHLPHDIHELERIYKLPGGGSH